MARKERTDEERVKYIDRRITKLIKIEAALKAWLKDKNAIIEELGDYWYRPNVERILRSCLRGSKPKRRT